MRKAPRIVRKRLASGELKVYTYGAQPAPPPAPAPEAIVPRLIRLYRQSPEWDGLASGTKRRKHRYFARMIDEFGWMLKADLEDKQAKADFTAFRNKLRATPTESDLTMDCLTALLNWAVDAGELDINRARRIKRLAPSGPRRAHLTWSPAQIAALEKEFPPTLIWAAKLALYTAAREGDLCAMRWADLAGNSQVLCFMPSKTSRFKVRLALPTLEFAPLRGLLASIPRIGPTILTTVTGKAWQPVNLRRAWTTALKESSLAGCGLHFHDLRGTFCKMAAEAGATAEQIRSVTGHGGLPARGLGAYLGLSEELAAACYRRLQEHLFPAPKLVAGQPSGQPQTTGVISA
jgi:integrase